MKCPLSWLLRHLETEASLETIAETLTRIGLTVEGIFDRGGSLKDFRIGRIAEIAPHPNADRLKLCRVEIGDGRIHEVVCGAPNARAGLLGVFAPVGAVMPLSGERLKASRIRGVLSEGMLCSEAEIGIGENAAGIIDLDGIIDVKEAKISPGVSAAKALGLEDPVLDLEITPNRPDCLGVRGIARELAAAGLGSLAPLPSPSLKEAFRCPIAIKLSFAKEERDACPHFVGRLLRGVEVRESPLWLRRLLEGAGLRPISAPVDITNYLSLDEARPLHVYDAERITGAIGARLARKSETLKALDGEIYNLDESATVIADEKGVLGLAGLIGGEASAVHKETRDIFIESAWFSPKRTGRTGRALGIDSEARRRFERGVDPLSAGRGCDRAARMIADLCGGEISAMGQAGAPCHQERVIKFPTDLTERLTGHKPAKGRAEKILTSLGCAVKKSAGRKTVLETRPPSWRRDLNIPSDLAEEIIRMEGVEKIPMTPLLPQRPVAKSIRPPLSKMETRCRRALAVRGASEAMLWSLLPEQAAAFFAPADILKKLRLANPLSAEMSHMRPSLVPGLILAAARNFAHARREIAIFEAGAVFSDSVPGAEERRLSCARHGLATERQRGRHWTIPTDKPADLFDAKSDCFALLHACGLEAQQCRVKSLNDRAWHPSRSGEVFLEGGESIARFGEIHPEILEALEAPAPLAACEVRLSRILKASRQKKSPVSSLAARHPLRRDFAFIVERALPAEEILKAASSAIGAMPSRLRLFDVYEKGEGGGGALGEGRKSIAIEATLYPEKALNEKSIARLSRKIAEEVKRRCGGVLRDDG